MNVVETPDCAFLSFVENFHDNKAMFYLYDGKEPTKSFFPGWIKVERVPTKFERVVNHPNVNHRFVLIDESMASEKIPLVLTVKEAVDTDQEDECLWKPKYRHLQSLYRGVSDPVPNTIEEIDFEIASHVKVKRVIEEDFIDFSTSTGRWKLNRVTDEDVKHQLIDELMFPDLLMNQLPSKLTSDQMYLIVREHVKTHLDVRYAKITSDYDFCFTVKKRIIWGEGSVDSNFSKNTAKNKKNANYQSERDVTVFEMTSESEEYKGYTVIPGMIGENHKDLKDKVDKFLEDLMAVINEPLVECPHCQGRGVVFDQTKK